MMFKRFDIQINGDVYMRRWTIVRLFGLKLMLHKMERPDADRCLHDHPWWFISLVLRRGYMEEVMTDGGTTDFNWNWPGKLLFRGMMHTHRVSNLPNGPCWTLVLRGRRRREWGFHTIHGWMPWRMFDDERGVRGDVAGWCEEK